MRRTNRHLSPMIEVSEPRVLLSVTAPYLSQHALSGVVQRVTAIMNTLSRTENTDVASASLDRLSSRLPSSPETLASSWQSDLALYHPHSARSLLTTHRRILSDLHLYIQSVSPQSNPVVSGLGSTTSPTPVQSSGSSSTTPVAPSQSSAAPVTPAPTSNVDSVTIQNTTGLSLVVTVYLQVQGNQQPWISRVIPAQGNTQFTFNFDSSTRAFMTMNVSRSDGQQSPPPFDNIDLSQPLGGYDGAEFTISLFGSFFNITAD